jgi:hypothetical protein
MLGCRHSRRREQHESAERCNSGENDHVRRTMYGRVQRQSMAGWGLSAPHTRARRQAERATEEGDERLRLCACRGVVAVDANRHRIALRRCHDCVEGREVGVPCIDVALRRERPPEELRHACEDSCLLVHLNDVHA